MIRLYPPSLSQPTTDALATYQRKVVSAGTYTKQVAEADKRFAQYNRKQNSAFAEVRGHLTDMCCGPRRCHYCEDSVADEVEHMAPKALYPDRAFLWSNYCYACGPCNGPKNNKYAVLLTQNNGILYEVPPHPVGATILTPPPAGADVLIDPRSEDPLDFMLLDLGGGSLGFRFSELDNPGTVNFIRADYTIRILHLNDRTDLVKARRLAYTNFRARLRIYIQDRDEDGSKTDHIETLRQHILDESHQTVWQEMKRQRHGISELSDLFAQAPEALTW